MMGVVVSETCWAYNKICYRIYTIHDDGEILQIIPNTSHIMPWGLLVKILNSYK